MRNTRPVRFHNLPETWIHTSGLPSGGHKRTIAYYALSGAMEVVKYEVISERFFLV